MAQRLKLQTVLESLLGSRNVYFQPPPSIKMKYPAIVYERDAAETKFADNNPYSFTQRYAVTLIDPNPDSEFIEELAALPRTVFSRHFTTADLNHDVFTIYF